MIAVVGVQPIVIVVAAWNAVTVVAVASNTDNVAEPVVIEVVIIGDVRVTVVPFVVAHVIPQKTPALLYWSCVLEPHGVHHAVSVGCIYSATQLVPHHQRHSYHAYCLDITTLVPPFIVSVQALCTVTVFAVASIL